MKEAMKQITAINMLEREVSRLQIALNECRQKQEHQLNIAHNQIHDFKEEIARLSTELEALQPTAAKSKRPPVKKDNIK
jgi:phage host-nuclease inhibitor protein Gam